MNYSILRISEAGISISAFFIRRKSKNIELILDK